jgi:transposase
MDNTTRQLHVTVDPAPGTVVIPTDDPCVAAIKVPVVRVSVAELIEAQAKDRATKHATLAAGSVVQVPVTPLGQEQAKDTTTKHATVTPGPVGDDTNLPDDVPALQTMIHELLATVKELSRDRDGLQERLHLLLQKLFGPKAERFDPNQPWLIAEMNPNLATSNDTAEPPADESAATDKPKAKGHGRKPLPENLRRERVEYTLTEAERVCPCCGVVCAKFGEDVSEQLDYHPASVFVRQNVRFKYACQKCHDHITVAHVPIAIINKGLPGPGLLAQIVASKYADHLPLHRLERILGRYGIYLNRSTMCDWMAHVGAMLQPVVDLMGSLVRESKAIHTDATKMPYLNPDLPGKTISGQMWDFVGDRDHSFNVFAFCPNHTATTIDAFLKDNNYRGHLNADALNIYNHLFAAGHIIEVGCWVHCRRYFYDAKDSDPVRAHVVLARIRQLYAIEDKAKKIIAEQKLVGTEADALRLKLRQEQSLVETTLLHQWLLEEQPKVLPKSLIGQAIAYALRHWQALMCCMADGFLALDNNIAELTLRHIAIGRKNWLFAGSAKGARTAAILFSVASTCHRHGVDVFAYLRDILERLAHEPNPSAAQLRDWLPDRWQPPPERAPAQDTS